MTQYAYFDATAPSPQPVLGWYDTAALNYPNLPDASNLLELTPTQWATRLTGQWAVADGMLVAYSPPATTPSLAQQAMLAFGAGLRVTSASAPAIDASYAIDAASQAKIAAVEVYILKNGAFPGMAASYPWPTLAGAIVTFPNVTVFQDWATAVANYVSALDIIIATNAGALPSAIAAIA